MKRCCKCKVDKPLEAFSKLKSSKDGLQRMCSKCHVAAVKASIDKKPEKYKAIKRRSYRKLMDERSDWKRRLADMLGRVCKDCGYSNLIALEFDHLDGTTKKHNLAYMISCRIHSFEDCVTEALKCELVCSNCHAIRTHYRHIAKSASY